VADLTEMSWSYRTDKGVQGHGFTRFYDQVFAPFRHEPVTLLEIGVAVGGSLMLWDEYFDHPAARIIGVDKHPYRRRFSGRVELVAEDVLTWEATGHRFDIVLDDGSHLHPEVLSAFSKLWPHLRPGGLYVVEDLHCMAPQHRAGLLGELREVAGEPLEARFFEGQPSSAGRPPGALVVMQKGA
jgi:cephalosporin hydroxylase